VTEHQPEAEEKSMARKERKELARLRPVSKAGTLELTWAPH
jgi:hypothetical protein